MDRSFEAWLPIILFALAIVSVCAGQPTGISKLKHSAEEKPDIEIYETNHLFKLREKRRLPVDKPMRYVRPAYNNLRRQSVRRYPSMDDGYRNDMSNGRPGYANYENSGSLLQIPGLRIDDYSDDGNPNFEDDGNFLYEDASEIPTSSVTTVFSWYYAGIAVGGVLCVMLIAVVTLYRSSIFEKIKKIMDTEKKDEADPHLIANSEENLTQDEQERKKLLVCEGNNGTGRDIKVEESDEKTVINMNEIKNKQESAAKSTSGAIPASAVQKSPLPKWGQILPRNFGISDDPYMPGLCISSSRKVQPRWP